MDSSPPLVRRLLSPDAYPHAVAGVRLVETHISWVFLTGDSVYKVKKPVDLGFLDFSSLERRKDACAEEVRLNRRFAPELYLGVVPIAGPPEAACVGGAGEPVEWAVRLVQFDEAGRLDRLLDAGSFGEEDCVRLAAELASIQERLERPPENAPWGTAAAVGKAIDDTLAHLRRHRGDDRVRIDALADTMHAMLAARTAVIEGRRRAGRVRQCHGDLHLANLVLHRGRYLPFDAIEFSEPLRWIDVASDVAFLAMDLESRGRGDLAAVFTSAWIEAAGDHAAAAVLPLYRVYRAVVRAAVAAIRGAQAAACPRADTDTMAAAAAETDRYLALAERLVAARRPVMVATCAVSGSGKTTLAGKVAAALGGIRLRSDVERKRVVGMAATDRPPDAAAAAALYSEEASRRTYERLAELARETLGAGTSVVVDAACLRRRERRVLAAAAAAAGAPLVWLAIDVPEPIVLERVARRQAAGHDPSDADDGVVRRQFASREPVEPAEFGPAAGERVVRVGPDDMGDPRVVERLVAGLAELAGTRDRAEIGQSG